LILNEEVIDILVARVNVDLGQCVMECRVLNSLLVAGFEPLSKHPEFASVLEFINELGDWAYSDTVE